MDFTLLDVAIGLVLIYTLLSLLCSTINEGITSFLALRANTLEGSLENLLGSDLAKKVYCHHLVQGLVPPDFWGSWKLTSWLPRMWRRKPSYIPTRTFVLTLLANMNPSTQGQATPGGRFSIDDFRLAVQGLPDDLGVKQALTALVDDASGDLDKLKVNLGSWFDSSMERVSGWYRRRVKWIIMAVSAVVSFGLGVDTVLISQTLWTDPVLRAALVKEAEKRVQNPPPPQGTQGAGAGQAGQTSGGPSQADQVAAEVRKTKQSLQALSVPMFPIYQVRTEWCADSLRNEIASLPADNTFEARKEALEDQCVKQTKVSYGELLSFYLGRHFLGCILTTFALSLGAPFWFDLLNKLVNLRSAGQKPAEGTAPAQV